MHPRTSSSGLVVFAILHHIAAVAALFFFVIAMLDWRNQIIWNILGWLALVPAAVFSALILHRGWSAVQDGRAQTTPGKAVGFCFIPFFNLYWNFVASYGLMKEFNRLAAEQNRPDRRVSEGFALTESILAATICLALLALPFRIVFIWQTIGAVKDLENS